MLDFEEYDLDLFLIEEFFDDIWVCFAPVNSLKDEQDFIKVFYKSDVKTKEELEEFLGLEERIIISKKPKTDNYLIYKAYKNKVTPKDNLEENKESINEVLKERDEREKDKYFNFINLFCKRG